MFHMKHMYKTKSFLCFLPFFQYITAFWRRSDVGVWKRASINEARKREPFIDLLLDRWLNAEAPCGSMRFMFGICGNYRSIIYSFCFCVISQTLSLIQPISERFLYPWYKLFSLSYSVCKRWMFNVKHMRFNINYLRRRPAIHCAFIKHATNISLLPCYV